MNTDERLGVVLNQIRQANRIFIVEDETIGEVFEMHAQGLNPNAVVTLTTNLKDAIEAMQSVTHEMHGGKVMVLCDYNFPAEECLEPKPNARGVFSIVHANGWDFALATTEPFLEYADKELECHKTNKIELVTFLGKVKNSRDVSMGGVLSDSSYFSNAKTVTTILPAPVKKQTNRI